VDAYTKDAGTGIVRHSAEACIGCQYCTWNCSYGVPQYNAERGVVGKCDMCYDRLTDGREPACVSACPEGAIRVEIVKINEWKQAYAAAANAPGLPSADDSISTTRITVPPSLPPDIKKANFWRLKTEEPHWPLVVMTVLTQLSVGAFATIWLLQLLGGFARLRVAALGSLLVGCMALGASTLHLGRPIYAYRALRMWKRSWLSREVLLFACFSGMSALYASSLWLKVPGSAVWGALTTLFGLAGVTASSCIYLVRARPAWNSKTTVAEFFLTAALLGPLFAASIGVGGRYLLAAPGVSASAALLNFSVKFLRMSASDTFELKASAWLLSTTLASWLLLRGALLIGGGIMLPLLPAGRALVGVAFGVALSAEVLGRYLFFVSVVPKNMADSYLAAGKVAA
jgi:DMSO reductase anchor subunit